MQDATQRGFTKAIHADFGSHDLALWVKPDTDLDGSFIAVCDLTLETLTVQGWNAIITEGH